VVSGDEVGGVGEGDCEGIVVTAGDTFVVGGAVGDGDATPSIS